MRLLGLLISYLSRICARVGGLAYEIATFLNNILPALLSADELSRLIRVHYEGMYGNAAVQYSTEALEWGLEPWEEEVVVKHKIVSGTTIVLGAGVGRESIALAQRGLRVIGLDINHDALCLAAHTALSKSANVAFVQASPPDNPQADGLSVSLWHHVQLRSRPPSTPGMAQKPEYQSESRRVGCGEFSYRPKQKIRSPSTCVPAQCLAGRISRRKPRLSAR
jgi:hypothetical protein